MTGIPDYPNFVIGHHQEGLAVKFRREVSVPGWGMTDRTRKDTVCMTEQDLSLRVLAEGQNSPYAEMRRQLQERKSAEGKGLICAKG